MLNAKILKKNAIAEQERHEHADALSRVSVHNAAFHELRREFPYFGYIDIEIETAAFVMFSNNDDPVAQSYFWFGQNGFEPLSLSIFHRLAEVSGVIFDIGSFTGAYALCAQHANPDAKVVAFEPSRSTWERAKINFAANRMGTRITLNDFALSSEAGQVEFNHYRGRLTLQSGASFMKKEGKEVYSTEIVQTRVGDDLTAEFGALDLMKIDVEGAELLVLQGLQQSIQQYAPICVIEIESENIAGAEKFFTDNGYRIRAINDVTGVLSAVDPAEKAVVNYLAWPQAKQELVAATLADLSLDIA